VFGYAFTIRVYFYFLPNVGITMEAFEEAASSNPKTQRLPDLLSYRTILELKPPSAKRGGGGAGSRSPSPTRKLHTL
jgi:hypothetical protein